MSQTLFAVGQVVFAWAARWLFFCPGNGLLVAAEWCQRHAGAQRARDGPE